MKSHQNGTSTIEAAGGVLWRSAGKAVQVALVHRPKYDDWSLPKGKLEPDEISLVAAVREVQEETGFEVQLGRALGSSSYRVLDRGRDVPKTVRWWAMCAARGTFHPSAEVDELVWLSVPAAIRRLTTGHDAAPLRTFAAHPPETTTLLLLRHGSAGSRTHWAGPDGERPLDRVGQRQAEAATQVLALYRPTRVLSAPPVRCVQTVAGLAARLGVPLELDPHLSEHADGHLVSRLRRLAADGHTVALCSQGGVLPHAVCELTGAAGLDLDAVEAPKGSLWALTWSGTRLIDADHQPQLTA